MTERARVSTSPFDVRSLADVRPEADQARASQWIATQLTQPRTRLPAVPLASVAAAPHRVNQLDAVQLDDELSSMLRYQVLSTVKYAPAELVDRLRPELDAALHALIWSFSVAVNTPSPGDQLQNLKYRSTWSSALPSSMHLSNLTATQRTLHGLMSIGVRWGWQRLSHAMTNAGWSFRPETDWRKRAYLWTRRIEITYRCLSIVNFMAFLYKGRYRSLLDRALGMSLVYIHPKLNRQVSFEFMNQQLVWSGLAEFVMFLMPMLNLPQLRAWFSRGMRWLFHITGVAQDSEDAEAAEVPRGCAVCAQDPIVNPYAAQCGHCFCYTCLAGSRLAESRFRCPRCDEPVTQCDRAKSSQLSPFVPA